MERLKSNAGAPWSNNVLREWEIRDLAVTSLLIGLVCNRHRPHRAERFTAVTYGRAGSSSLYQSTNFDRAQFTR